MNEGAFAMRALRPWLADDTDITARQQMSPDVYGVTIRPGPRGWRAERTYTGRHRFTIWVTGYALHLDRWALLRAVLGRLGVVIP